MIKLIIIKTLFVYDILDFHLAGGRIPNKDYIYPRSPLQKV